MRIWGISKWMHRCEAPVKSTEPLSLFANSPSIAQLHFSEAVASVSLQVAAT